MSEISKFPDWLKIKECKAVTTYDLDNKDNGYLVDILNINDELMKSRKNKKFTQIYMSTVKRGVFKGLHMHPTKLDAYHCASGKICFAIYPHIIEKSEVESAKLDINKLILIEFGEGCHKTISLPSKYPHGFFGIAENSVLLNYRDPAWDPTDTHQFSLKCDEMIEMLKKTYSVKFK